MIGFIFTGGALVLAALASMLLVSDSHEPNRNMGVVSGARKWIRARTAAIGGPIKAAGYVAVAYYLWKWSRDDR